MSRNIQYTFNKRHIHIELSFGLNLFLDLVEIVMYLKIIKLHINTNEYMGWKYSLYIVPYKNHF